MKTGELAGVALDWAVAVATGHINPQYADARTLEIVSYQHARRSGYCWSLDWARGGPLVEEANITVMRRPRLSESERWWATDSNEPESEEALGQHGPTPLVAAMRCFVASKLGDEIDIPKGLQ